MGTKQFVSISGITNRKQLDGIHEIVCAEVIDFPIVIGYQVSHKSINTGSSTKRQPRLTELGELVQRTGDYGFTPAFHYYTKDSNTITADMDRLIRETALDSYDSLLQFNMLPPSTDDLNEMKKMGFDVIFKVAVANKKTPAGGVAVWKGDIVQDVQTGSVDSLFLQVYERSEVIDYVMFDPSHGTNQELNLTRDSLALLLGEKICSDSSLSDLGLVYAGGISPENVCSVAKTLKKCFSGRASIDVESGIRDKDDEIDMASVRGYLIGARELFLESKG